MLWGASTRRWWPGNRRGLPSAVCRCRGPQPPRTPCRGGHLRPAQPWPPRYYGCGPAIPERLAACRVLDLGSGSGRDCFVLSQLVGEQGHVTGIDMTEGQVRRGAGGFPSSPQHPPATIPCFLPGGGGEEAHCLPHGQVWLPKAKCGVPSGIHGEAG